MTVHMKQTEVILNCIQSYRRTPKANTILKKKDKAECITRSDVKIFYKAIVTTIDWHCVKSDVWSNGTE